MRTLRPPFAQIVDVLTDPTFPTVANTTYKVMVQTADNQWEVIGPVKPNNRRPFDDNSDLIILPARKGDIAGVYWNGDQCSFMIIEGVATSDCPYNPPLTINQPVQPPPTPTNIKPLTAPSMPTMLEDNP